MVEGCPFDCDSVDIGATTSIPFCPPLTANIGIETADAACHPNVMARRGNKEQSFLSSFFVDESDAA